MLKNSKKFVLYIIMILIKKKPVLNYIMMFCSLDSFFIITVSSSAQQIDIIGFCLFINFNEN